MIAESETRRALIVSSALSAIIATLAAAVLVDPWGLEVHVPIDLPPDQLDGMSQAELCQIELRTLTGLPALQHIGWIGIYLMVRYQWLVLFGATFAGSMFSWLFMRARPAV